jgi:hypothetical protein
MRASENSAHLGAILVDASIQPGINYTAVVQPRVNRILRDFPSAATLSGLRELLRTRSVGDLLLIKNARKCSVFESLVNLLQAEGVDSCDDLRRWIVQADSRGKLLAITGIGIKTAAYLRLLLGLPAIAIDVHLRRLAAGVGVKRSDEELEILYVRAAEALGMSSYDLDGLLWQNGSRRARPSTT